jgi:hypothetical protein
MVSQSNYISRASSNRLASLKSMDSEGEFGEVFCWTLPVNWFLTNEILMRNPETTETC